MKESIPSMKTYWWCAGKQDVRRGTSQSKWGHVTFQQHHVGRWWHHSEWVEEQEREQSAPWQWQPRGHQAGYGFVEKMVAESLTVGGRRLITFCCPAISRMSRVRGWNVWRRMAPADDSTVQQFKVIRQFFIQTYKDSLLLISICLSLPSGFQPCWIFWWMFFLYQQGKNKTEV